jgi:hypothetical protein
VGGGGGENEEDLNMPNTASGRWSVVTGGANNTASESWTTVGGGWFNHAAQQSATVAGGTLNLSSGANSTVSGGSENASTASHATIGGGAANTNQGLASTIGGGRHHFITSDAAFATVPGGHRNVAAARATFAAGYGAEARHDGAFVWADTSDFPNFFPIPFSSTTSNEFSVLATGGVRFVSAVDTNRAPTAGVTLAPGSGAWATLSDRHAKENFSPANGRDVLEKVAALPLATWNYKSQDKSIRHIGPTAQDFHTAFGVGENERTIATVDADGVALAAIQGLNQKLEEQLKARDAEIEQLKHVVAELKQLLKAERSE